MLYKGHGVGCVLWNKLRNGRYWRSDRQEMWHQEKVWDIYKNVWLESLNKHIEWKFFALMGV